LSARDQFLTLMKQDKIIFRIICLWLACHVIPVPTVYGAPAQSTILAVDVILSEDKKEYRSVYASLSEYLQSSSGNNIRLLVYVGDDYVSQHSRSAAKADLLVTIGTRAAKIAARTREATPVLSVFIPKDNFEKIWHDSDRSISAIVIDQPINRFVELLAIILDKGDKVGVFSPRENSQSELESSLKRSGLALQVEHVDASLTAKNITRLINNSDIILVLPDKSVISPQRSKWLLYMAYREQKPVIAFSSSYVKSGALAAIYTTPETIGKLTALRILEIKESPLSVSEAVALAQTITFPDDFSINTNKQVVTNLGIKLPEDETLKKEIFRNIWQDSHK